LISGPFQHGLVFVLSFSIVACLIAAAASALRGGRYIHKDAEQVATALPESSETLEAAR
jgi:hypothetical protein